MCNPVFPTLALAVALACASFAQAQAQTTSPERLSTKPVGKVASPAINKQVTAAQAAQKPASSAVSEQKPASAPASIDSAAPKTEAQLLAERVLTGPTPCELKQVVNVQPNAKKPGRFSVSSGKTSFDMVPVPTSTGAIRLEDKAKGGVWLQLGNKSMLMNEKLGQRVADNCVHPQQQKWMAEAATKPAQNLFEAPAPSASPAASASAAPAAPVPAPSASR